MPALTAESCCVALRNGCVSGNWSLANLDATLVAQAPRMAPHIEAMCSNLAEDLGVERGQVNVKATTTEKLGFAGREEGIAAHAVVLLRSGWRMTRHWPRALGQTLGTAVLRIRRKISRFANTWVSNPTATANTCSCTCRNDNSTRSELVQRLSQLSGVPSRDIGYCGLKDRNAVTRQWLSVGLAGRPEPDWAGLEATGKCGCCPATPP